MQIRLRDVRAFGQVVSHQIEDHPDFLDFIFSAQGKSPL